MRALSLKQPWAELILVGRKTIETRPWNTPHRGEFLIHASKRVDVRAMQEFGFKELPTGCIVGKATLVSVKEYPTPASFAKDKEHHEVKYFDWHKPRYGFLLKDVQRCKPVPYKGMLNFFPVDEELVEIVEWKKGK